MNWHSVDKEMAHGHTQKCRKWVDFLVKTTEEWHSLGINTEAGAFNIFLGNTGSGIECTLSRFANATRMCGDVWTRGKRCHLKRPK